MRRAGWMLLSAIALWSGPKIDTGAILAKFDQVRAMKITPDVPENFYDPFVRTAPLLKTAHTVKPVPPPPLPKVEAILNDRALIGKRWVGAGDRVGEYRILSVKQNGVIVRGPKRKRFVPIAQPKRYLNDRGNTP